MPIRTDTYFMIFIGICLFYSSIQAEQVTYAHLVDRLTNLEHLAKLPPQGETTTQASSYNRASVYNEKTNEYQNWFAHADGTGYVRKTPQGYILAEMEGPGCIWRIWTALPGTGKFTIILDGRIVLDMPFNDYFNHQHPPFHLSNLTYQSGSGYNSYVPISYQKSCIIIAQEGWGTYYNIGYTTFAPNTVVETFNPIDPKQEHILTRANHKLSRPHLTPSHTQVHDKQITLLPQQTEIIQIEGPQAITAIKTHFPSPPTSLQLRNLTLNITWDLSEVPSVWSPFGDFLGTTFITSPYQSLTQGTNNDTAYAYWFMPFEKSATIKITNEHITPISFYLAIFHKPLSAPITQYTRFHAFWHKDLTNESPINRKRDWPLLLTSGPGRYCGTILNVWNPLGGWWGEGDEKFFVDGESFPSTFGTGTEDYFGYAWADPTLFFRPFHGHISNDGLNRGHITHYRWHIADNIPFQRRFEGYIEKYLPNQRPTTYDCTVFWYAPLTNISQIYPLNVAERTSHWSVPSTSRRDGYLEGEQLRIAYKTGGNCLIEETETTGILWRQQAQLWWVGATQTDTLTVEIPITKAGVYNLQVGLTQAPDYGIFQIALNKKKVIENLDLYHPIPQKMPPQFLGRHHLSEGIHHLTIIITGHNPKAIQRYRFGLDYIHIQK